MRGVAVTIRVRGEGGDGSVSRNARRAAASVDGAFLDGSAGQQDVYRACGAAVVEALFDGHNACIFAYGQTGSGKTHTMLGKDGGVAHLDGIIPQIVAAVCVTYRAVLAACPRLCVVLCTASAHTLHARTTHMHLPLLCTVGVGATRLISTRRLRRHCCGNRRCVQIFRQIKRQEEDATALAVANQFQLRASFVEVWKERVYDLLSPRRQRLDVREDKSGGDVHPSPVGAVVEHVHSARALMRLLAAGSPRRATKATGQNEHSSRSHALLSLSLEHRWLEHKHGAADAPGTMRSRTVRLMLVDLAGSESTAAAHDGASDAAGCAINIGLLALGQVCAALADGSDHVPFRSSLLTRLLQSSLAGSCHTALVACVSDHDDKAFETARTLQFAQRVAGMRIARDRVSAVDAPVVDDPMRGDVEDADTLLRRRTVYIETAGHGDVYARVSGCASDPLMLYVHGSGPRNSSLQWNHVTLGVAARSATPFFHVSVDCPGYGRTDGDCQTIRSYPAAFLRDVMRSLGKTHAYCLVGSSQVCASMCVHLPPPLLPVRFAVAMLCAPRSAARARVPCSTRCWKTPAWHSTWRCAIRWATTCPATPASCSRRCWCLTRRTTATRSRWGGACARACLHRTGTSSAAVSTRRGWRRTCPLLS
jgi:hypothetical protein